MLAAYTYPAVFRSTDADDVAKVFKAKNTAARKNRMKQSVYPLLNYCPWSTRIFIIFLL